MKKLIIPIFSALILFACDSKKTAETDSEEGAVVTTEVEEVSGKVFFVSPNNGDSVSSPVTIVMGVEGMEIEPAGVVTVGKGHHHLIIDGNFIEKGVVVPADSTHKHYGKGQTEAQLELSPGNHTITMQFADGVHTSYGEDWSTTISIFVNE
ncbi:MAG: DUF4399 domain-containing protein [Cyclobacteriaceae bacterium]|nr:DUF4399 domain-containing protein [Cyclobacteriaceae bacterium]